MRTRRHYEKVLNSHPSISHIYPKNLINAQEIHRINKGNIAVRVQLQL